ncbi:MAG: hypothetical protein ACYCS1_08205 [Gammaproteobacteria bacterium]
MSPDPSRNPPDLSVGRFKSRCLNLQLSFGYCLGLALAVEGFLLCLLGVWLWDFNPSASRGTPRFPVTVHWLRRVLPPGNLKTRVHSVHPASRARSPFSAPPRVIRLGYTLAPLIPSPHLASMEIPLRSIPWTMRGLGSRPGGRTDGRGGGLEGGLLLLPGWGQLGSSRPIRHIHIVCPRSLDRQGSILFERAVNAQSHIASAWVAKSNCDTAEQRGVTWAVRRQWRFAPLVPLLVDGRPTTFRLVDAIHVPAKPNEKAMARSLEMFGGKPGVQFQPEGQPH